MIHVRRCKQEHPEGKCCRNYQGAPLIVPPGGGPDDAVAYRRASSFGDCLDDKTNLGPWSQACAVRGAIQRPELRVEFASVDDGWVSSESKKAVKKVIEAASIAGGSEAKSTVGTALHTYSEKLDRGQDVGFVPDEYRADLSAWEYTTREMTHLLVEPFCVYDAYRIGGSPDRLSFVPDRDPDGVAGANRIVDLKSGSIDYPHKMVSQLRAYSRSTVYSPETFERHEMPQVDQRWGVIVHLPAGSGRASLHWLRLDPVVDILAPGDCVDPIELANAVKAWRSVKGLTVPFAA